ncbi:hypothetical protein Vadar_001229 [Vaccinium darrowii]|uniref:Uncharacterized protein n=1 Tax=Vaccinium darrowii TaxID=229202 RepID=A0ACB7XX98_9ERIC|nr:hypothetical protein Vadar_001229 [Vaccinium darrowii]
MGVRFGFGKGGYAQKLLRSRFSNLNVILREGFVVVPIMRFECGAKVEVMSKKDVLISWKSAEIISGNGRTYIVMYDCYPGSTSEMAVERVPRKAIRPCPPHVEGVGSWVAGDVVEVLESFSWKIATISKVLDRDYYLVRLLGVPQEFRVHKSNTRVRQSWEESKWVVIGKGRGSCKEVKSMQKTSFQMLQATTKIKLQGLEDCFAAQDNGGQQSHMVSSRTLKRASPYCSSPIDAYTGHARKVRAMETDGRSQRFVPSFLREKGRSWRHASLASKDSLFLRLAISSTRCSVPLITVVTLCSELMNLLSSFCNAAL